MNESHYFRLFFECDGIVDNGVMAKLKQNSIFFWLVRPWQVKGNFWSEVFRHSSQSDIPFTRAHSWIPHESYFPFSQYRSIFILRKSHYWIPYSFCYRVKCFCFLFVFFFLFCFLFLFFFFFFFFWFFFLNSFKS